MSELFNNSKERANSLFEFARRLIDGENGRLLIAEYTTFIETVTAAETMQVLDSLLLHGYSVNEVKRNVGKIINVFSRSLNRSRWDKPGEGHFLYYLMMENREVEKIIAEVRPAIRSVLKEEGTGAEKIDQLKTFINRIRDHADFWIQTKGLFIHIRYFALRNEKGEYLGTIEVSQDVTEIRKLEGEKKLLDCS